MDTAFYAFVIVIVALIFILTKLHSKNNEKKVKGTLLVYDKEAIIVELDNEDSMKQIFNSEYVTFRVKHCKTR